MNIYGIYSAGGFAREIRSSLVHSLKKSGQDSFEIVYIDDDTSKLGETIHGSKVVSYDTFMTFDNKLINVAFADPVIRKRKVEQARNDNVEFFSVIASSHVKGDNVVHGDGSIFAHNTVVTSDAIIGDHFHCNIFSYVAHDCVIGDFVTFSPRVSLNGRVIVEDMVYIGTNAIILPGKDNDPVVIGEGAVIGAGSLVTKSVEKGATVVGSPAKPLQRRPR
jgi:sugar O-acyltransferase (sialic acid O-acetyltransferase NeuD family)